MWLIIGMTRLISGVLWLAKNEVSDITGKPAGPDRGSDGRRGFHGHPP